VFWAWIASVAFAGCESDRTAEAVAAARTLEDRFVQGDIQGFEQARAAYADGTDCLLRVVSPEQAVELHVGRAVLALVDSRDTEGLLAWRAVRALNQNREMDREFEMGSDTFRALWEGALDAPSGEYTPKWHPKGGWVVDGRPSLTFPTQRAFVAQALDRRGRMLGSGIYNSPAEVPVMELRHTTQRKTRRAVGTALGVTAMVAGGVMAGWGFYTSGPDSEVNQLASDQRWATARNVGWAGTALAGVGLTTLTLTWAIP